MIYHEAIIVGGGLAGLRAAVELNLRNIKVAVISKVHPLRSHSIAAQGGVNAPLGNHPRGIYDNWEKHAYDTIKGGDYLADQDAVVQMCKEAHFRIYELEHWGCPFSRTEEGKIAQRPFGGAGFPRTAYAADRTGHAMLNTLYEQTIRLEQAAEREEIVFYDEWLVTSLISHDDVCIGVIALDIKSGELEAFKADSVIFATGGAGKLYGKSTNALINTGYGMAVSYWAGVPLKDMEFVQFHPTTLYGTNILITEGARGEGGYLINKKGERFLANYEDSRKAMEIAPRDVISRNMMTEILKGNGFEDAYLHLDLRHLGDERIMTRLPGIREISMKFAGVDPVKEPIPVQPGQHYTMGGIDTNTKCETVLKGFYAAGESACISVHGANRLGGNSLLDTVVFGVIAGENAAAYIEGKAEIKDAERILDDGLKKEDEEIRNLFGTAGKESIFTLWKELNRIMDEKVGIFREESILKEALEGIKRLQERFKKISLSYKGKKVNFELYWALELKGSLDVAEIVIAGAIARRESRGSHFRTDYPTRDDNNFLKHTIATYTKDGPELSYKDVTLGYLEPKERRY
ncbi:MAG: FAD-dependent oxidoreductase [Nitrospirota bacterium]